MNERIKQLANKAGITVVEHPFDDATQSWNNSMEKFAELIVRECAGIAHGSDRPGKDIKEHFGVE
jgi:hypothetical protein